MLPPLRLAVVSMVLTVGLIAAGAVQAQESINITTYGGAFGASNRPASGATFEKGKIVERPEESGDHQHVA